MITSQAYALNSALLTTTPTIQSIPPPANQTIFKGRDTDLKVITKGKDVTEIRVYFLKSNQMFKFYFNYVQGSAQHKKEVADACNLIHKANENESAIFVWETLMGNELKIKETIKKEEVVLKVFDIKHLEQVIMPKEDRQSIIEALSQEQSNYREILFNDWGFGTTFEKGKGVILLFYGVPGTGKTMLAEKIANYVMKDYVMLGNAELQSQVPGQMERNIQKAFSDAKDNKRVIIFDECDALLTNRNKVGTILGGEINSLLTEIERFEGVCILTTNRNIQLDPALERRIALKMEFKEPTKEMRKEIWKALIPKQCPINKDVCWVLLLIERYLRRMLVK